MMHNNKQEHIKPLVIKFKSPAVEKEYNKRSMVDKDEKSASTLPELMKDIQANTSGTHGMGKSEVLRHLFMGHKGCLSRRIGGGQANGLKDKLVYKVTGPAEITILTVGGHYEYK